MNFCALKPFVSICACLCHKLNFYSPPSGYHRREERLFCNLQQRDARSLVYQMIYCKIWLRVTKLHRLNAKLNKQFDCLQLIDLNERIRLIVRLQTMIKG